MEANFKNEILEIIVSHIYSTYFYQLPKLEIDDRTYIKSLIKKIDIIQKHDEGNEKIKILSKSKNIKNLLIIIH
jgi:hypothetical protein